MNLKKYFGNAYRYIYKVTKIGILYKLISSFLMFLFFCFNIEFVKRSILLFNSTKIYTINIFSLSVEIDSIQYGTMCLMGVIVCSIIFKLLADFCMSKGIIKMSETVQNELVNLLQETNMSFYIKNSYGAISDTFNRHLKILEEINNILFLELIPGALAFVAVLSQMIGSLKIVVMIFAIIFSSISFFIKSLSSNIIKKQGEYSSIKYSSIADLINAIFTTKIFKTDAFTYNRVTKAIKQEMNNKLKHMFFQNTLPNVLFSVGMLLMAPISIECLRFAFDRSQIAVEYNAFSRIMLLFGMRIGVFNKTTIFISEIEQTLSVFSQMQFDRKNGTHELESIQSIEIRNLTYSINENVIFKNLNVTFNMGDKILIMGSSGVGKSTLLNIIEKFIETDDNCIFIKSEDGISYDINNINNDSLYEHIGYVTQEPYLFPGSLRENIAMGRVTSDTDIARVLRESQLLEKAQRLGVDAEIEKLSGGQKQRLSLARFFLKNYSVVCLDEITGGLDPKNSLKILARILEKYKEKNGKMIILAISHDISWVNYYNKILFIEEDGKYTLDTHDALYASNKEYRQFFHIED